MAVSLITPPRRCDGQRTGTGLRIFRLGWFNEAAISIGLTGLTPHESRHTAASLTISAGANVKAAQRMLGHAKASVTLDVFEEDLDAVAVSLNAAVLQTTVDAVYADPRERRLGTSASSHLLCEHALPECGCRTPGHCKAGRNGGKTPSKTGPSLRFKTSIRKQRVW